MKIGLILTTKSIQLWHFDEEHWQFKKKNWKIIQFFLMNNVKCKNTKSVKKIILKKLILKNNSKFALIWQILLNKWPFRWTWKHFSFSLGNENNFFAIRSDTFYSICQSVLFLKCQECKKKNSWANDMHVDISIEKTSETVLKIIQTNN